MQTITSGQMKKKKPNVLELTNGETKKVFLATMEREDTSGSLARMGKSLVDKEMTTEGIIHGHTGRR